MNEGARRFHTFNYKKEDVVAGNTLTVTLLAVVGGKHVAGVASFMVDKLTGNDMEVHFVYSSDFIDATGSVVAKRGALIGVKSNFAVKFSGGEKSTKKK
jgi:hypothetical protein